MGDNTSTYAGVLVDLKAFSCTETILFRLTETHFNYQYILRTTHYIILSRITTIYYSIRTQPPNGPTYFVFRTRAFSRNFALAGKLMRFRDWHISLELTQTDSPGGSSSICQNWNGY